MEEAKLIGSNLYSVIYNRGRLIDYINEKEKFRKTIQKSLNNPQLKRIEYLINSF